MPYSITTYLCDKRVPAAGENRISICLLADGFSFAEVDAAGTLAGFGLAQGAHPSGMTQAMADIKAAFAQVGIRPIGYQGIELVMPADEHVWVPTELYSPAMGRQYLRAVGGEAPVALAYDCPPVGSTDVFAANDTLATAFKVAMPGLVAKSQHAKVAESSLRAASRQRPQLLVHLRQGVLDVALFRAGKYLFGNSLPFANAQEGLFQVIEVMRLHALQGADTELLLCGAVDRDSFALFRPYFATARLYGGSVDASAPAFKGLRTYLHALVLI